MSTRRLVFRFVTKRRFGEIVRKAREEKAYSLRQLADQVGIDYSRLAKIEGGTRPAPGLVEIRRLADLLDVDMSNLLVSSGTPREVMDHLLWSERLQWGTPVVPEESWLPERSLLLEKNTFRVRITRRDGALCTVKLGKLDVTVFHFGRSREISVAIPPEAILVFRDPPAQGSCTAKNLLPVWVRKLRHLGQVSNLVLVGEGFELSSLHAQRAVDAMRLEVGDPVHALIPATAIHTASPKGVR
jgi:transcriptional regulator with XRE-family HTH domain/molybdopterin-binding protein